MKRIMQAFLIMNMFVGGLGFGTTTSSADITSPPINPNLFLAAGRGAPPGYYMQDYRRNSRNNFYRDHIYYSPNPCSCYPGNDLYDDDEGEIE